MTFEELHKILDKEDHNDFNISYNYQHKYMTIYFNDEFPIKKSRNKRIDKNNNSNTAKS